MKKTCSHLSLHGFFMELVIGFEPTTCGCSYGSINYKLVETTSLKVFLRSGKLYLGICSTPAICLIFEAGWKEQQPAYIQADAKF